MKRGRIGSCALWEGGREEGGRGDGGDLLAQKMNAMPEYANVEIGIQTHSHCMKNKKVHNFKTNETAIIRLVYQDSCAYSMTSSNSFNFYHPLPEFCLSPLKKYGSLAVFELVAK